MNPIDTLADITKRMKKGNNPQQLASELLEWKRTGTLKNGLFRKYAEELEEVNHGYINDPFRIIESYVVDFCLEKVAESK